jgi:hypothetical protein
MHVWRARIVLLTADGLGTAEVMRRTGKSKSVVWRWQQRFMHAGVDGLLLEGRKACAQKAATKNPRSSSSAAASLAPIVSFRTRPRGNASTVAWTTVKSVTDLPISVISFVALRADAIPLGGGSKMAIDIGRGNSYPRSTARRARGR